MDEGSDFQEVIRALIGDWIHGRAEPLNSTQECLLYGRTHGQIIRLEIDGETLLHRLLLPDDRGVFLIHGQEFRPTRSLWPAVGPDIETYSGPRLDQNLQIAAWPHLKGLAGLARWARSHRVRGEALRNTLLRREAHLNAIVYVFRRKEVHYELLDDTNPLAELAHRRKVKLVKNARHIKPAYYGRLCPLETPE